MVSGLAPDSTDELDDKSSVVVTLPRPAPASITSSSDEDVEGGGGSLDISLLDMMSTSLLTV